MRTRSALSFITASCLALLSHSAVADTAPIDILIAHVGGTTGAYAHIGKDNENGVRMALDELNRRRPSIGGRPVRFVLQAEDDAADPRQATMVAQRLCDRGVAAVVGHMTSGTAIAASHVYNDCGIPHVSPSATNPKLTQLGHRTAFRLVASDHALGASMAAHAAALGLKRVAVLDDRSAYGQGVAEVFERVAKERGLQIVARHFTQDKATDFSSILTDVKASRADVIFFGGMDAQAGPMLRQMEHMGLNRTMLMGGDGLCTRQMKDLSSNASTLQNVRCAEGGIGLDKMNGGQVWKQRYDARFPGQFQVYSPYSYDATMILVDAMIRAQSTDPQRYLPMLARTNYTGVSGKIAFDANGDLVQPSVTIFRFVNGDKQPVATQH